MPTLMAGVGRTDISPVPETQGGWGAQTHQRGTGVDLPLLVTALVVSDGSESVAIADVDAISLSAELEAKAVAQAAEMSGIPPDRIRISHTHTHSGPNIFRLPMITEGLELAMQYIAELPHQIAEAIREAAHGLRPARVSAGVGSCAINGSRRFRTPDGRVVVGFNSHEPVDHAVRVLRLDDLNGAPVATVVHYACHPTIVGWENQLHTPDYPGMVRRVVEEQIGGTCLFLQGAAGNVGPCRGFTPDLRVYRRLGRVLGLEAARVALELEAVPRRLRYTGCVESGTAIALYAEESPAEESAALRVISREICLPVRPMGHPEKLEARAVQLRAYLNELRQGGEKSALRDAAAMATQAGMRADRARLVFGKTHLPRRLMGIALGPAALVSTQGEPFVEIGQNIAAASPFAVTMFSGYSHGGVGYICMPNNYEEGGYEIETTPFAPEAAAVLQAEAIALLQELEEQGPHW